jgi:hypothetical protein
MEIVRRIFISVPNDKILNDNQREFKWTLIKKIEELGFIAEIFYNTQPNPRSKTIRKSWTFEECINVIRRCVGAIIIGLPRHSHSTPEGVLKLPTEYAHFEGALSIFLNLPTFLLKEKGLYGRGVFSYNGAHIMTTFPDDATSVEWLSSEKFKTDLDLFLKEIHNRKDIFLGYCSTSKGTARTIKLFIEKVIGATILDWQTDFSERKTIIEEIEDASKQTSGAIFLFTRDDKLDNEIGLAAPRDNVVFEAGFFAHAKGREKVLIIREEGAKMPADLGGIIYATLKDRSDIEPLEEKLRKFIDAAM